MALLRSIAAGGATREGPLGQARTLYTSEDGQHRALPKQLCNSTNVLPPTAALNASRCVSRKSDHWNMQQANAAGAAFANAILRALFGFQPPLPFGADANASAAAVFEPAMGRGFDGALQHLAWRGGLWTLHSVGSSGVRMEREPQPKSTS